MNLIRLFSFLTIDLLILLLAIHLASLRNKEPLSLILSKKLTSEKNKTNIIY